MDELTAARETDLTTLMDGRVSLRQPVKGYRAGMDAVMLAASLQARPGEHLVEFGCGPGGALLCAAHRLPDCRITAYEVESWAAELAQRNVAENALGDRVEVVNADIAALPPTHIADQVFFNPPFYDNPAALRPPSPEKARAWMSGEAPLSVWIKAASRTIRGQGYLTLIHRADALDTILRDSAREFGSAVIRPIQPREDRSAKRVLVRLRKGGRAPLVLLPPLVLHEGEARAYAGEAERVYRGDPLFMG